MSTTAVVSDGSQNRQRSVSMRWSQLRRNEKQFLLVCIAPILLNMTIFLILLFTVGSQVAAIVQFMLNTVWMIGAFTYIIIDSRSRWPEASAFQRFANTITFKR